MYIIDIPDGAGTGPSASFTAAAEAVALAKRKPPLVQVSVNGDDAILEAVQLIHSARTQMELLTNTINERFNVTFFGVGDKITNIVGNIDTITDNIAHSSSNLNQPVLFMMFVCVFLMIFIVILLFFTLKTRREYRKWKMFQSTSSSENVQSFKKKSSETVRQLKKHIPSGWRPLYRNNYRKDQRGHSDSQATVDVERDAYNNSSGEKAGEKPSGLSSSAEYSTAPTLKKRMSTDTLV